jgi:type VI secretion system protein ImpC
VDPKDDGKDKGKEAERGFELGGISFGFGKTSQPVVQPPPEDRPKPTLGEQSMTASVRAGTASPEEGMPLLALRAVLVADLVPRDEFNAGAGAPEQAIRVDPTHFDGLFQKLKPRLALEVDSVLSQASRVRIDLSPTSMKSFRPDGLCREVPLLRSLLDGKMVLERLRDGSLSVDGAAGELDRLWKGSAFARQILGLVEQPGAAPAKAAGQAASAAAEGARSTQVSNILDMVDTGTEADAAEVAPREPVMPEPTPGRPAAVPLKGMMDELIAAVVKSGRTGRPGARPDEAIRRVEKAVSLQLGAILQHPELRRLEAAWRGVELLIGRVGTQPGVRIEVVSASPDKAADALEHAIRTNAAAEPPVSFAIVDDTIDGTTASFARLEALATVAEDHSVPVVLNGSPRIFGYASLGEIDQLDNKATLYDARERAPWRALTAKPSLRWVSLCCNRLLGRTPYDRRASRVREAEVEELPSDARGVVWLSPCWGVGALVVQSFRKTGWPCRITGTRDGGTLENLPVREVQLGYEGSEKVAIPTEALIAVESQRALGRYGILAFASAPNSDEAYLLHAATAYITPPKRTYDSETTEPEVRLPAVTLGDQLFVARLVQFLRALAAKIPPDGDPAEVKPVMEGALWALFENAPPGGPEISVEVHGTGGAQAVAVTVKPRRFLGVGLDELSLEIPLG